MSPAGRRRHSFSALSFIPSYHACVEQPANETTPIAHANKNGMHFEFMLVTPIETAHRITRSAYSTTGVPFCEETKMHASETATTSCSSPGLVNR